MVYNMWRYKMKHRNDNMLSIVPIIILIAMPSLFSQERQSANQRLPVSPQELQETPLYLNPEQEAEVLEYLEQYSSENAERLSKIKELRPDTYREQLSRAFRQMVFLENLKESDPEQYQRITEERILDSKSILLANLYKDATNENEKKEIRAELENLLYKLFDYRQMNRIIEIERLEERLANLKDENQNRLDNKDEIIENRLSELLGEKSGIEW